MGIPPFSSEGLQLRLFYTLRSRRPLTVFILDPLTQGTSILVEQIEKQLTPLTPKVKSVHTSIIEVRAISSGSRAINWRDY